MFGRYRMLGRIAAGGMAEVWAAQLLAQGGFCKQMVIKRVLPELASNPSFLRMLMTEARVAARLSHTNICAVFELGDVDGEYYIAMEYLRGAPLSHVLKTGRLDPATAVAIVAQACDGLHYAHEQRDGAGNLLGLVHRDVSPHNLFVTVDGIVKVLDFGIAKVDDGSSERTEAGKVKGKLAYMSPEQLAADPLDRRSDVWSLGCVLWELISGQRLFGGGPAQTIDGIRNARVPTLASVGVEGAERLDDVLGRAICKNREWRYGSAAELRRAMVDALAPVAPVHGDGLSQLIWARCGAAIRAQDQRFEGTGYDDPGAIDRLPLRAGATTQVSQEVFIENGVASAGLTEALARLDDVRGTGTPVELRADTSPDLPSNRAGDMSGSAHAPVARRRRGVVLGLIALAMALGMVAGVVMKRGGADNRRTTGPQIAAAAPPAATDEPAARRAPEITPLPAPPTPTPAAVVEKPAPPTPSPAAVVEKPAPPADARKAPVRAPRIPAKEKAAPVKDKVTPVKDKAPPPPAADKGAPGKLYVDAQPWATITVDGQKLGATPIIGAVVPAGDHVVKAVTEDGRSKVLHVHVDAGGTVRRKVTW